MSWFYNLIIILGTVIMGILAFSDQIAEKYPWLRALKSWFFKLVILVFGGILIFIGTNWKDDEAEQKTATLEQERQTEHKLDEANQLIELKTMDSTYREEKRRADSVYRSDRKLADTNYQVQLKRNLDSSYTKSIKASNEALAKYNLVLIDSLEKATQKINLKSVNKPQLAVDAFGKERGTPIYLDKINDETVLKIRLRSANNISYNVDLNWCIANKRVNYRDFTPTPIIAFGKVGGSKKFVLPDVFSTMFIPVKNDWLQLDSAVLIIHGTFSSDAANNDKQTYIQSFQFNFMKNKIGYEVPLTYGFIDFLKRFNVIE